MNENAFGHWRNGKMLKTQSKKNIYAKLKDSETYVSSLKHTGFFFFSLFLSFESINYTNSNEIHAMQSETRVHKFFTEIDKNWISLDCRLCRRRITNPTISLCLRYSTQRKTHIFAVCDVTEWIRWMTLQMAANGYEWNRNIVRVEIWWDCAPKSNAEQSNSVDLNKSQQPILTKFIDILLAFGMFNSPQNI